MGQGRCSKNVLMHFKVVGMTLLFVAAGYAFPGEIHAKFSKKQGKYTFRCGCNRCGFVV
jgi:hypothetical protein